MTESVEAVKKTKKNIYMQFKKATRQKVKLRLSIASPTGFGKTYSALLLAYGITNDWNKIAVVDTENESASLYSDLGEYNTVSLGPPFTTQKYIDAIKLCESEEMEVIIIDSITHVWKGEGGLLEYQNALGGRYQDWAKATPLYQKWLNAILHSSCHVITTMRKKQAYALVTENGKNKVEKKGMEDEIRDGYDYEMTIAFEIVNDKHLTTASKDRTRLFDGKPEFIINESTGNMIKDWCDSGIDIKTEVKEAIEKLGNCDSVDDLKLFKETLAAYVITDETFKIQATKRFNEVKTKKKVENIIDPELNADLNPADIFYNTGV